MEKTVCELFAGVGGFRCGLNHIHFIGDANTNEIWNTVYFNQWEPTHKKIQYGHDCYVYHFGSCKDLKGNDTSNYDISEINKSDIPNHSLLVAGFPCQSYSVASTLATSKGIEGDKGILWWQIRDVLEIKQPPFVLLENVDRLIRSPANQKGRDFGIILSCFRDLGYFVEWRIINASEYGYPQRRKRVFIFAYKKATKYGKLMEMKNPIHIINTDGFFASSFPIMKAYHGTSKVAVLPKEVGKIYESFTFLFENSGIMQDGTVYTVKTFPNYQGNYVTLGNIKEIHEVSKDYFVPYNKLYYTDESVTHSDEREIKLSLESRKTWQYIKGAKKLIRISSNGHRYIYSEGSMPMIDEDDKPARTLLTSEGSFSRSTHLIRDTVTGNIRFLVPEECERIQGFPTEWTKYCLSNNKQIEIPTNKRRFLVGNALVVGLIEQMEPVLSKIFDLE